MDRQHVTSAAAGTTDFIPRGALPRLEAGDQLDQPTFHARYEAMPPSFRAELVEGVVIVPSPLLMSHGESHALAMLWLGYYQARTPGVKSLDNATTILSEDSEPQPDGSLILDPRCGGQTRDYEGYVAGAPELIVEVASSSESYDLHSKFRAYQAAGVREYLVVLLREKRMQKFVLREKEFVEQTPDADGVVRSELFPGLWLDSAALMAGDAARMLATLDLGLATPEHARPAAAWKRALAQTSESTPSGD